MYEYSFATLILINKVYIWKLHNFDLEKFECLAPPDTLYLILIY